jgi:hypothetical protein
MNTVLAIFAVAAHIALFVGVGVYVVHVVREVVRDMRD